MDINGKVFEVKGNSITIDWYTLVDSSITYKLNMLNPFVCYALFLEQDSLRSKLKSFPKDSRATGKRC